MSLLRRRMLMAANKKEDGGGDSPIDFPLYLYYDYCEENFGMKTCVREADELGETCVSYLIEMINTHGFTEGSYKTLDESILDTLGIEIYIDDEKMLEIYKAPISSPELCTASAGGIWTTDGTITMDF